MTKYILVGGYPRKAADGGKAFAEELVKGFKGPVKILLCFFARSKEDWEQNMIDDQAFFKNHLNQKQLIFKIAEPDNFIEQIKWADAVYIRGGRVDSLFHLLKECKGWEKKLEGKTLAGSSAGAYAIAKYNYNLDTPKINEGLNLLPIKVLVHYKSDYNTPNIDWDKALEELKNYKEDLPIHALKEGEFVVITR